MIVPNIETRVRVLQHRLGMGTVTKLGKRENFTAEQLEALKKVLTKYLEQNLSPSGKELTQEELAKRMSKVGFEIKQQSIGRFKSNPAAGINYQTATGIAHLGGYSGVDELFVTFGVASGIARKAFQGEDVQRTAAMAFARRSGISDQAIDAVNKKEGGNAHTQLAWLSMYERMQDAINALKADFAELKEAIPKTPTTPKAETPKSAVPKSVRPRRRRVAG